MTAAQGASRPCGGPPRPAIGCTGQIRRGYDGGLIEGLARRPRRATFAFAGPVWAGRFGTRPHAVLAAPALGGRGSIAYA